MVKHNFSYIIYVNQIIIIYDINIYNNLNVTYLLNFPMYDQSNFYTRMRFI